MFCFIYYLWPPEELYDSETVGVNDFFLNKLFDVKCVNLNIENVFLNIKGIPVDVASSNFDAEGTIFGGYFDDEGFVLEDEICWVDEDCMVFGFSCLLFQ